MTQSELLGEVRELIGNPGVNEVTDRCLGSHLAYGLEWLAAELKYHVREESMLALVESQATYPLPDDFGWLLSVDYNGLPLEQSSIWKWERDGTLWRSATDGTPCECSVYGRELILYPPPSDDAIETDAYVTVRYIAAPELQKTGVPLLGKLDQRLAILQAAIMYLSAHPGDENQARVANYERMLAKLLPPARWRAKNAMEAYQPGFKPAASRRGTAR